MEARLKLLFNKYMNGSSSAGETKEFWLLVNNSENETIVHFLMDEYLTNNVFSNGLDENQKINILSNIFQREEVPQLALFRDEKVIFSLWKKLSITAIVLIALSIGVYFAANNKPLPVLYSQYNGELVPGGNKATLTLANGTKLSLTDAANGKLIEQSGVVIRKTAKGQLFYEVKETLPKNPQKKDDTVNYNTISTPAGGAYQIFLPDGTHVWLNSTSSLRYPTSFAALKERRVKLTGEAYFEVAKVSRHAVKIPFIVDSKHQQIEVLGTHFNINNYDDEGISVTTLLEGSVKVSRTGAFEQIIRPGEEAQVNGDGITVVKIDTSTAVAWKNGLFKFENATINTVMSQFSRWYDVDVEYEGQTPKNRFTGEIYRNMDASKALMILSYAKINYRIEAPKNSNLRKKIVIIPN